MVLVCASIIILSLSWWLNRKNATDEKQRLNERIIIIEDEIPYSTVSSEVFTSNLRPVELFEGYTGQKEQKVKQRLYDNVVISEEVISETIRKEKVWHLALKDKVNPDRIVRIYDLSKCKKISVVATAYYPGDPMCYPYSGYETFLGLRLRRGIVAVDPSVIPLRSKLYIPEYGYGIAGDTGGWIKGNRIDLCYDTRQECFRFGRKKVDVYILE